jgi:hypothetical protein
MRAAKFFKSEKIDYTGWYNVFGQIFKPLYGTKFAPLMINNSIDRTRNSKFIGKIINVGGLTEKLSMKFVKVAVLCISITYSHSELEEQVW